MPKDIDHTVAHYEGMAAKSALSLVTAQRDALLDALKYALKSMKLERECALSRGGAGMHAAAISLAEVAIECAAEAIPLPEVVDSDFATFLAASGVPS